MSAALLPAGANAIDRYRAALYERWTSGDEMTALRRSAFEEFAATGFPTQRHEDWKYTSLRRLESRTFAPAPAPGPAPTQASEWIAHGGARIVLLDGRWSPALSSASALPPGVTVSTLAQWSEREAAEVAAFLTAHRPDKRSALEQLNLAFHSDGVVLQLSEGAETDEPIYIVHQWSREAQGLMSHPRLIVRAGRSARCTLIEQYLGPEGGEYFTNSFAMLELAPGARMEHYRLQQESVRAFHIGAVHAHVERDSCYALHDVALGASIGRTDVHASLDGAGAHTALHGLIAPAGSQHLDAHTCIDHVAPHTSSTEDYRGVAHGRGRGVFNGKVIVRPDAQKVDARQSSRNLLLSATAEIDTKPELEIYANDVKCSHGATTGQLDATALFYLRARGLSERDARALLIRAFAESILTAIEHAPLKTYLERCINARFTTLSEVDG